MSSTGVRSSLRHESPADMRRRFIFETEVTLQYGHRFPERIPRIPTVEVGRGTFSAEFASEFWRTAVDRGGWNRKLPYLFSLASRRNER